MEDDDDDDNTRPVLEKHVQKSCLWAQNHTTICTTCRQRSGLNTRMKFMGTKTRNKKKSIKSPQAAATRRQLSSLALWSHHVSVSALCNNIQLLLQIITIIKVQQSLSLSQKVKIENHKSLTIFSLKKRLSPQSCRQVQQSNLERLGHVCWLVCVDLAKDCLSLKLAQR